MHFDPERHHRRGMRLPDYDYTQDGAYYITLCTHGRECLFGEITDGEMQLNRFGDVVREEWERTALMRNNVILDAFVVMPNHVHGIVVIDNDCRRGEPVARPVFHPDDSARFRREEHANLRAAMYVRPQGEPPARPYEPPTGAAAGSLGAIMAQYKSIVSKKLNVLRETPGWTVWQRNYYERIIRNEEMLDKARRYIESNPARWTDDVNNPANGQ